MATYKGIEVQINGNATGLGKALEEVNKVLSKSQSNLNEVNKQLKFDTKNPELLAQKQAILSEEIENTKIKLTALKDVEAQVKEQFESGDLGRDKYIAFQTELSKTENSLDSLKRASTELANQGFAELGKSLEDVGSKIESAGNKFIPLSATIGGVGLAGLKVATDFEKAMSSVQAITGATDVEFDRLRESAIDLGATTAFSSQEVAGAMTEMAKAGWSTQQILDGMGGVLDATSASGEELGTVSTIVADAITGFGLSAKDSTVVADLLTQSANAGTIGITEIGESYKYIAPLAQSMGFSIQDVTTAISAMSTSGIKGSQAGTSLRTAMTNLVKPTADMEDAMLELGLMTQKTVGTFVEFDNGKISKAQEKVSTETRDLQKAQIDLNTAIKKYGEESSQAQKASIKLEQAEANLAKANDTLNEAKKGNVKTSTEMTSFMVDEQGNMKSLDEIIGTLRNSFKDLTEEEKTKYAATLAGKEGMSGLLSIMNLTQEEYDELSASMDNSNGVAKETAEVMQDNLQSKLEQLGGALESLAIKFSEYVIPFLTEMAEKITESVEKFTNLDESTQKIILVIGGVLTALAPVLIIGGKLIGGIGLVIKAFTAFSTALTIPVAPLLLIIATIGAVVGAFVYLWNTNEEFRDDMITIWNVLSESLMGIITPLFEYVKTIISGALDIIMVLVSGALDIIVGLVQVFSSLLTGDWQGVWDGVLQIVSAIFGTIYELMPTWLQDLIDSIIEFATNFYDAGANLFGSVLDGMKDVWSGIVRWVTDKVDWLADKLSFWRSGKSEMSASDVEDNVDGSHSNGLSFVPFDNYIAKLHLGERVLTAEENKAYSNSQSGGTTMNVTQNIYVPTESPRALERQARRELVKLGWEV